MGTRSNKFCDHCGLDDSTAGVGPGNVRSFVVQLSGRNGRTAHEIEEKAVDLCTDCQKELHRAIKRWIEPSVKKGQQ